MGVQLTADEARQSLTAHVEQKGREIYAKYGPRVGWQELLRIVEDRAFVRYPCTIVFDSGPLLPGEVAHPVPKGSRPEDGFAMCVHPLFLAQLERVPLLVFYQLVVVNYGEFASSQDAEIFSAAALGLKREDYYRDLCALADELGVCAADAQT